MQPGTQLGQYEVVGPLGKGGMGEVYLARDPDLRREVAIKVLPALFAGDEERVRRLEREAHLLAALNHPNVATIHGLERAEGPDGRPIRFLVMEAVEGETVAERIRARPIGVDEALQIALQIARGLEAAHAAGIVHRDLKPANVKITDSGRVKLLDFGLAKAGDDPNDAEPGLTTSPTLTVASTARGVLLGTAGYMSPEQARGLPVDERTDIWAFGCVLFEMLTARSCFTRQDVQETLASVLRDEPDWSALPHETPARVRIVLRRCLHKKPSRRWHHTADVAIELEEALEDFGSGPTEIGERGDEPARRISPIGVLGLLLGAAIAAPITWQLASGGRPEQGAEEVRRLNVTLPEAAPYALWSYANLAISSDGRRIVYAAQLEDRTQLYVRDLSAFEALPIPGTEEGITPFLSPDGDWVGYFTYHGQRIRKVSLAGGAPVTVAEIPDSYGADWGEDGFIYFNLNWDGGLARVPDAGGEVEVLVAGSGDGGDTEPGFWPQVLPGSRGVLHAAWTQGALAGAPPRLEVYDLVSGENRPLLEDAGQARYVETGHLVYRSREALMAVAFDVDRLEVVGSPSPLPEPVSIWDGMAAADFDLSNGGVLVYIRDSRLSENRTAELIEIDRRGEQSIIAELVGRYFDALPSPDGRKVALVRTEPGSYTNIWSYDLTRGTLTRVTQQGGRWPAWNRDSEQVTYYASGAEPGLYRTRIDGSAPRDLLLASAEPLRPHDWLPDDRRLVVADFGTSRDLFLYSLDEPGELVPLLESDAAALDADVSPDGRWLAYVSTESGDRQVMVQRLPGPGPRIVISGEGGHTPLWSSEGDELFYLMDTRVMRVGVEQGFEFRFGAAEFLFDAEGFQRDLESLAGSRGFVSLRNPQTADASRIAVVLDLRADLERLAPRR